MHITIAICTWNRCKLLGQTLEQMTRLEIPPHVQWELLIVNNNSTDATSAMVASFSRRLPIRERFEPRPGLSHARNRALTESQGDYILWTDDDVSSTESGSPRLPVPPHAIGMEGCSEDPSSRGFPRRRIRSSSRPFQCWGRASAESITRTGEGPLDVHQSRLGRQHGLQESRC